MTEIELRTSSELAEPAEPGWKTTWMIGGGLVGALLGVFAVYLYIRSIEADEGGPAAEPRPVKPGAAMQVVLSVLTTIKQFANLGLD